MTAKEQIREIIALARDLEMAMSIKEQVDRGEQRGLAQFSDGENIKVPIPPAAAAQLDGKIGRLRAAIKQKTKDLP